MPNPITAYQQFAAIAYLRWRLFANGFRRKGGKGELAARIIAFPFAALFVIGPVIGASVGSYFAIAQGHPEFLPGIFWAILILQVLVSFNISPPALSFDPQSLTRFPLDFSRYLVVRIFLGLLSASTIIGTCALLAAATGVSIAKPRLAPVAFAAAVALALCNMIFIRTIFAWIDRWFSTRRAREIFTGLIIVFSIGIQYINVTVNDIGHKQTRAQRAAKLAQVKHAYQVAEPVIVNLPPGLAGGAILDANAQKALPASGSVAAILAFACLFLAIFGWRMHREYRGENLSETSNSPESPVTPTQVPRLNNSPIVVETAYRNTATPSFLSPIILGLLQKEWIYIRRNPAQFYGLLAPLAMVFLFAGRMGNFARTGLIFPAAVAYSVLGVAALAYNILGIDAAGVQFYFLAPIHMRSVILAKNLFGFCITGLQLVLVYLLLVFTSGAPSLFITTATLCWVVFASLVNATVGNMRSITSPKVVDPSKISRKQASQLSALICIGIILVIGALGAGLIGLAKWTSIQWLPIPVLLALAAGAFAVYLAGLRGTDQLVLNNRETMIEELTKTS